MEGKFLDRDEVMDKFYFFGEDIPNDIFKSEWIRLDKALKPDGRYLTVSTLNMEELIKSDTIQKEISHGHLIYLSTVHATAYPDLKEYFAVVNATEEGKFLRVLMNMVKENYIAGFVITDDLYRKPQRRQ